MRFAAIILFLAPLSVLAQKKITYHEQIEPIVLKRCAPCHQPGTAAPFSLLTYNDVSKHASMIARVTEARYMPPWKADPTYRSFANEKVLSQEELDLIRLWVEQGYPEGKASKKKQSASTIAAMRKPDTVLTVQKPFIMKGDKKERFILFVIPFEFDEEYNVESIQYTSSNFKIVHHANFGIYAVDPSVNIFGDEQPIDSDELAMHANRQMALTENLVYYNGWVPGATPITFPEGIGFKMPRRGVIVVTNHYAPSTVEMTETSSFQLFFSKKDIVRKVNTLSIGSGGVGEINPPLILLPNEVNKYRIQMEITEPLSLLYVWPHMHLLGKKFVAYYALGQDTIPLVRVNDWDFNWQEAYKFKKLMKLPPNAVLTIEGTYDNTSQNPNNPNNPPQMVFSDGLMGTKNEMLSLIIVYLPYKEGDEIQDQ